MQTTSYTYRITDEEGSYTETLVRQLMGDALLDARTATVHMSGTLTIEILRAPFGEIVLSEQRRDGKVAR